MICPLAYLGAAILASQLFAPIVNVRTVAAPQVAAPQPASKPAGDTVYTLNNEQLTGTVLGLENGTLQLEADPPRSLHWDEIERVELASAVGAVQLTWIGQDNKDFVQPGATAGPNGIQDVHLRCSGLPAQTLTQAIIACRASDESPIWLLEPGNTQLWRLQVQRVAQSDTADIYFEPPAADCFDLQCDITLSYDNNTTVKARVRATTHTDAKLKVGPAENTPATLAGAARTAQVRLERGESLRGEVVGLEDESLALRLPGGQELKIPLDAARGCWLAAEQAELRKAFEEKLAKPGDSDWVLLLAKDMTPAPVEGSLERIADGKLELIVDGERRKVGLDRVLGFVVAARPPRPALDTFHQVLELAGGEKFSAVVATIQPDAIMLTTIWGAPLRLPRADVRAISSRNGRAKYLSDFEPASVEETPYFGRRMPYRRDQNLQGGPLTLGGIVYRKGLAVHSRSVLGYDLDGRYASLRTRVGFEDGAAIVGSVACRVLADGRELYNNPRLRAVNDPVELCLPIDGVRQLVLEVDFGDGEDVGDRVVWAAPRVFRAAARAAAAGAHNLEIDAPSAERGARP
jgi:hypothetical protein